MKNTRYVKVNVSFVLCYDEPLNDVPEEMREVERFLRSGVEGAFVAKNRPNRMTVYICPYAKLSASLIHAPRGLPQVLAQLGDGVQTHLSRPQALAREARVRVLALQDKKREEQDISTPLPKRIAKKAKVKS